MGRVMARREADFETRAARAREILRVNAAVTEDLRAKIVRARRSDESWRGADPIGDRLDERRSPAGPRGHATLIAVDGSQVYPNRHDIAPYFLINIGSIVLRQGTGEAPQVATEPAIYYEDEDLYDSAGRLRPPEYVNALRTRMELDCLVALAEAERRALGGDLDHPIVALTDGPLLPWQSQRRRSGPEDLESDPQFLHFVEQLDRLCTLHVIPLGYVDRPSSANLLRTLELTALPLEKIDRRAVRSGDFRLMSDRRLLDDLQPNERSGLFASTTELNERLSRARGEQSGYQVVFFYVNVAAPAREGARPGARLHPAVVRVDVPAWDWLLNDPAALDTVQQALYADCALTRYPYTLARAHELAVVGDVERANLEAMLQQTMFRHGLEPVRSDKEINKGYTRRH